MNLIFKISIFISSYTPLIVMIFLQNMNQFTLNEIERVFMLNKYFWIFLFLMMLFSIIVLVFWLSSMKKDAEKRSRTYKLKNIKSHDGEVLNYFLTFIVPILSLDISSWPSIVMNLLLIIIEAVYFIRNNNLHFNVLLIVMGYRIYTDSMNNIIISKKDIYEIKNYSLEADQFGETKIFYI